MSRRISGRATALLLLCAALLSFFVFPVGAVGGGESQPALAENQTVGSRFLELFFGEKKEQDGKSGDPEKEEIYLVPGGGIFGMRIYGCGVTVAGEAEENSGESLFRAGDRILSVGGIRVNSCEQVRREVAKSDGGEVVFEIEREGRTVEIAVTPKKTDEGLRIGILLRDEAAGIGTLTYSDPSTGRFGGLGHGVCDSESGALLPMETGEVTGVILGGVKRGEAGAPGELRGVLTEEKSGELTLNSECGVFGRLTGESDAKEGLLPIGSREQIHEGAATIRSTLKNGRTENYTIEIGQIDRTSTDAKSFRIRVTDPALIAATGGIVRGMSGSPILQDGRLVGAVTHVMVNDPTEGYGIFIENMLAAARRAESAAEERPAA